MAEGAKQKEERGTRHVAQGAKQGTKNEKWPRAKLYVRNDMYNTSNTQYRNVEGVRIMEGIRNVVVGHVKQGCLAWWAQGQMYQSTAMDLIEMFVSLPPS